MSELTEEQKQKIKEIIDRAEIECKEFFETHPFNPIELDGYGQRLPFQIKADEEIKKVLQGVKF